MRLQEIGPNDREYGMQRVINGRLMEDSQNAVIQNVAGQLRHEWEKAKIDYKFPDNAVPEWRVSWYYVDRLES